MSQKMMEKVAYENGRVLGISGIQGILKIPVTESYLKSIGFDPDYSEYGRDDRSWWYEFRLPTIAMGISKALLRESYSRKEGRTYGTGKEASDSE